MYTHYVYYNIYTFIIFSAPVAGALCDKIGHRKVAVIGGFLAFLGMFLSAFSYSLELLVITMGFIESKLSYLYNKHFLGFLIITNEVAFKTM